MYVLATPCVHYSNICCIAALTDRTESGISRGCYQDLPVRAMEILEGKDHLLDGNYTTRKEAITKCVLVGKGRGYAIVGIQDGGMCVGSPSLKDFNKYGVSDDCKRDGKGGPWATEVHALTWRRGRLIDNLEFARFSPFCTILKMLSVLFATGSFREKLGQWKATFTLSNPLLLSLWHR